MRAPELPEKLTWAQVKIAAVAQKWPGSSKEKPASSERGGIRLKGVLSTAVSAVPRATEEAGGGPA